MVRGVCLLSLLVGLTGCIYVTPPAAGADTPQAGLGLEPGDRVLARWRAGFWQATVITVQGKLVTVAWDVPPPERSYLPRGWVAKKEIGAPAGEPGDWLLCRQEVWELCKLVSAGQDSHSVIFASDGETESVDNLDVAPVPVDLAQWAKRRGEAQLADAKLSETVNPAGPVNTGEAVDAGKRVLARWTDGNWYAGVAIAVGEQTVTVEWSDGSPALEVAKTDVASLPELPHELAPGDLAFCKGRGSSGRWWRSRIDKVNAGQIAITYRNGTKGRLSPGDCVKAK